MCVLEIGGVSQYTYISHLQPYSLFYQDMEKLKARAARFGSSVSPALTSLEDDAKKQQREQKFGAVPVTSLNSEVI